MLGYFYSSIQMIKGVIIMDAIANMITRRSIRKFKSDMVSKDIIEKIIEAGTYASTGMNRQSPIIIAVTSRSTRS